ncbi:MAG: VOC family protein [Pseudomonadota bacterium]
MMNFEHVNLVVRDLSGAVDFFTAAFPHWRVRAEGEGDWNGKARRWMHLGDDYQYITLNDNGEGANRDLDGHQTGLAHFGFVVDNIAALTDRLLAAGFPISSEGAQSRYRRNIYFMDPNGFEVEFVEYLSDVPEQRNASA